MKFINYLTAISGIEIFPMISFLIFFIFFLLLTIWAVKVDKKHIDLLKQIPLDNDQSQLNINE